MIKKLKIRDVVEDIDRIDRYAYPEENTDSLGLKWYEDRYDGNETLYVYYKDDKVVGYLVTTFIKQELVEAIINGVLDGDVSVSKEMFRDQSKKYLYLNSVAVDPEYRHQNIAHELIEECMNNCPKCKVITLANEHSYKALLKYNFKIKGKTPHYYIMTN